MVRILVFCFAFLAIQRVGQAQEAEKLRLTSSDLEGMKETQFSVYSENSLWGYINGGADIYLEYGFKELVAQNLEWNSEPFKVETYIMDNPLAAFGIFTVSRYSCAKTGEVGKWDCINPYQVQMAQGNMYVSIVAYSGTERSMELATEIARKIKEKHDTPEFELPSFFKTNHINFNISGAKFMSGPLAIQNAYATMELPFHGHDGYSLWMLPYTYNGADYDMLVGFFKDNAECNSVNQQIVKNDGFYTFVNDSKLVVVVGEGVAQDMEHISTLKKFLTQL